MAGPLAAPYVSLGCLHTIPRSIFSRNFYVVQTRNMLGSPRLPKTEPSQRLGACLHTPKSGIQLMTREPSASLQALNQVLTILTWLTYHARSKSPVTLTGKPHPTGSTSSDDSFEWTSADYMRAHHVYITADRSTKRPCVQAVCVGMTRPFAGMPSPARCLNVCHRV